MKNKFLKTILILFSISVLILMLIISAYFFLLTAVDSTDTKTVSFMVESGETIRSISYDLENLGLIRSSHAFYIYGRLHDIALQSGTFSISSSMSVSTLSECLESANFESIWVSFPEGLTVRKVALILAEKGVTKVDDFIAASKDVALLAEYNIPSETVEGYLFPDTYSFVPNMKAIDVMRIMIDNFFDKISTIESLQGKSPEELYYIVRFASIVEKEYRLTSEAPLIASVFENRLRYNIGLYSCATLVYIITEIQGKPHPDIVTFDDIAIDSPYNTYKWAGLTPTPISNPGLVALKAASDPADTNYYYFRLVDPAIGKHVFTTDFDDHIKAGTEIQIKSEY